MEDSLRLTYKGPHAAVDVPELGARVVRGEPVDIDRPIAHSLKRQGYWHDVKEGDE